MKSKVTSISLLVIVCVISLLTLILKPNLDIDKYLSLGTEGEIYPTSEQIALLNRIVPNHTYSPFPSIEDRNYWGNIATKEYGATYLAEAVELLSVEPEIPISDEIYRRANKEGNRAIYKPRYYRTMDRLERFLLAECIENKGRFLPQIENYIEAIISMKSWMHPNHDDKDNGVLEGRRVAIDLSARKFGFLLALCEITLTDKLPGELREKILQQIRYRITGSYLDSCSGKDPVSNSWIRKTNNWNSVCTSGSLLAIMTTSQDKAERVVAIGCALNSMKYYIDGFGDDGYCSEGLGYWNYGFGHYLYLAEILYNYTDGNIDLFRFNNPEKLEAVAHFPANYEIHNKFYAPFSDGVTQVAEGGDNFAYLMAAKHYGARKPSYFLPDESVFTLIGWRDAEHYTQPTISEELAEVTYFDNMGVVISRGTQPDKFSVAIKAGHNGENHNHNDVGSYFILLEDDIVAGDIGAPSYVAGAFSPSHPARSSWGHPVPRINGELQSTGIEFRGQITTTQFEEGKDLVKVDLQGAYEIPAISKLERTMTNDKSGKGTITILDEFEASEPVAFGTTVMVNVEYTIEGNTIILNTGNYKVKAEIVANGGEVTISDEKVPVAGLRSGRESFRIGIEFTEPLTHGSIEVRYMPL